MKRKNRILAVFCAAAVVLWCMAGLFLFASAESEPTGSLTLWCVKDDDIVVNMHWQIYRVGHRAQNDYVFEGDFAGYRTTLGDQTKPMLEWDAETVASAAEALKRKTIVNKITKRDEGYTNAAGSVTFDGLEDGLYLVWGDVLYVGTTTYVPSAIFFEMNGEEASFLNAYPKIILRSLAASSTRYTVRKVWENDEEQPWDRAVSIVVERYRDNEYYDEITLSEENEWSFKWNDTGEHEWFVYEKVIPEHYTVSYKDHDTQYMIVNTYEETTSEGSTTAPQTTTAAADTTDTQTDTQTDAASSSTVRSDTGLSDSRTTEKTTATTVTSPTSQNGGSSGSGAPQTGQLWWPVPALAAGGVLCFAIGLTLRKKNDEE